MPVEGEVHVVLRVAHPGAAPAPADRAEGGATGRRHHPATERRADEEPLRRRVVRLPQPTYGFSRGLRSMTRSGVGPWPSSSASPIRRAASTGSTAIRPLQGAVRSVNGRSGGFAHHRRVELLRHVVQRPVAPAGAKARCVLRDDRRRRSLPSARDARAGERHDRAVPGDHPGRLTGPSASVSPSVSLACRLVSSRVASDEAGGAWLRGMSPPFAPSQPSELPW